MNESLKTWLTSELASACQAHDQAVEKEKELRHQAELQRGIWVGLQRRINALRELADMEGLDVEELLKPHRRSLELNDPEGPFSEDADDVLDIQGE